MRRLTRIFSAFAFGFSLLFVVGAADFADARNARVSIDIFKAGFIIGGAGGSGTMSYSGRRYPISIGGISFGATIGFSSAQLSGTAYNMRRPSDIAGVYYAAKAGWAIIGGEKVAELKNDKGVVLRLRGSQVGLEFNLDLSGMSISLD